MRNIRHDWSELSFVPLADGAGIEVIDPIERHRYALEMPSAVTPTPVSDPPFRYPVDAAVSVRTSEIALPGLVLSYVRDESGEVVAKTEQLAHEELPNGSYTVELNAPVKLYVRVEGPLTVSADLKRTRLAFEENEVVFGARSHHTRPAVIITTTTDSEDLMRTVTAFDSALKTTSPERAYPTLRGNPPTVELGEELDIPGGLAPPATGITIELPPACKYIYPVAALAYYLGAEVTPSNEPLIRTDEGFTLPLGPNEFERRVERTLKQVFFLDYLTRTEGTLSNRPPRARGGRIDRRPRFRRA